MTNRILDTINDYWGESNVTTLKTAISDYLISCPSLDLTFAVKCMPETTTEEDLNAYKSQLGDFILLRGTPKLPIIIIKASSGMEEAQIGTVLYFHYGAPFVEQSIHFLPMDENNRPLILDRIKAADKTIRVLETTNCRVIKTIHLPVCLAGQQYRARLVYVRELNMSYRMKEHKVEKNQDSLDLRLKGLSENDYPTDVLDKEMLESVRNNGFSDAYFESKLLLFSSELRNLERLYERPSEKVQFLIVPDSVSSCLVLPNGFTLSGFNVDLYIDKDYGNLFKDLAFSIQVSLSSISDYYSFDEGTKSLVSIKQFLNIK